MAELKTPADPPLPELYVLTRGRSVDYGFLGTEPSSPWWRALGAFTSFEQPSFVAIRDARGFRLFASGIPTSRRDRVGTRIRLTLAMEAREVTRDGANGMDHGLVTRFTRAWFEVARQAREASAGNEGRTQTAPLAQALERVLTEERVEAAIAKRFGSDRSERGNTADTADTSEAELRAEVLRTLGELDCSSEALPPTENPANLRAPASWVSDGSSLHGERAFVERATSLASGEEAGVALYLNLAHDDEAAARAVAELGAHHARATAAVILGGLEPRALGSLRALKKKSSQALDALSRSSGEPPKPRRPRAIAIAIAIAVSIASLASSLLLSRL